MKKKHIMIIFGTRPEAIKLAPLVNELKNNINFKVTVCVTGQHKEMLDQVLQVFDIIPDYNLNIMKEKQDLFTITESILSKLKDVAIKECPDLIIVHGDTTTTFASSLVAFYLGIKIAHVEAGLRTYNKNSPYPEEFNRQATGIMADFHFAPTETSAKNLLSEGKDEDKIFVTGNTVIDALYTTIKKDYKNIYLDWAEDSKLVILTSHRRENIGAPMYSMFRAINRVVEENKDIKVIYPIHKNPKVRAIANEVFKNNSRVKLIEPLEVIDFHNFINRSYLILTDSGGVQEEAPSLGKPVLVLRDTTERPEGVKAGTLKLIGTEEESVYENFNQLINDEKEYSKMSKSSNPYGDGTASKKITDILIEKL